MTSLLLVDDMEEITDSTSEVRFITTACSAIGGLAIDDEAAAQAAGVTGATLACSLAAKSFAVCCTLPGGGATL